jgi:hypothetical protein
MLEALQINFTEKNNFFFKILILQESNHNIYNKIVKELHKQNYEIYFANDKKEMFQILNEVNISLIISEHQLINLDFFDLIPTILLFFTTEYKEIEKYIKYTNVIDYFFIPMDINFLINRIKFLLTPKVTVSNFQKNLHTYLWEAKLLQENKLHKLTLNNDYDQYTVAKLSQYIIYFSYILNLINDFFLKENGNFENLFFNIINIINSQLSFFNSHIDFKILNNIFPPENTQESMYLYLFLFFLGEITKNTNISISLNLNFFKNKDAYYCKIEFTPNLKDFFNIYNEMKLNRNMLHEYIQEFLWEHWKKKINIVIRDDISYGVEIFLKKI